LKWEGTDVARATRWAEAIGRSGGGDDVGSTSRSKTGKRIETDCVPV
jgi:hypothetical protein